MRTSLLRKGGSESDFLFLGILKRVIVTPTIYPRFLEFLHVGIHSTGRTLSQPWSRQPNDVMSEIECAQLHSQHFRRRNSTLQSHGLFLRERDYVTFGSLLSQFRLSSVVCLSVCRLSVTLVHPTQGVEPFGKISSPLCTLAIL